MSFLTSVRGRLLGIVALVVLPLGWLAISATDRAWQARRDAARSIVLTRVDEAQFAQAREVGSAIRFLEGIAANDEIARGSPEVCGAALQEWRAVAPAAWAVTRVSASGALDCRSVPMQPLGIDLSQNDVFLRMREATAPYIGRVVRSRETGELLLPVNLALRDDDGRFRGVLAMGVRMTWLEELAASIRRDDGDVVIRIVDEEGVLLARQPTVAEVGDSMPDHPLSLAPRREARGIVTTPDLQGTERVWGFDRLPFPASAQTLFVQVGMPTASVYAGLEDATGRAVVMTAALALLLLLIAWWAIERWIVRDVAQLVVATERIGKGESAVRAQVRTSTYEMQRLATAFDDMAERLQARRESELQSQRLEAIGQLAGGVAHDFNNLLTAILGHLESARETLPEGSEAAEDVAGALDASRRSAALTRQLLTFARRPTEEVRAEQVDTILTGLAPLLRRLAGERVRIELALDTAPDTARVVESRFEQAIVNLVVNARDAMPAGGTITIESRWREVTEDDAAGRRNVPVGRWLEVVVRDTGAGMDAATIARAFEPFFSTKPAGHGTGLGLATVFGTVRECGGHVWIDSRLGHGTAVHILLAPSNGHERVDTPSARPATPRGTASGTVLLVEDESAVRDVVARMLRGAGYDVQEAPDGVAADAWAGSERLGALRAVVTDVVMPGCDGPTLVHRLRARRPDLPVVLISGFPGGADVATVARAPHTAFLEKPFAMSALLAAIERVTAVEASA